MKVGDVVRLKGSGIKLTVKGVRIDQFDEVNGVTVNWFADSKIQKFEFKYKHLQ